LNKGKNVSFSSIEKGKSLREFVLSDEDPRLIIVQDAADIEALSQSEGFSDPSPIVKEKANKLSSLLRSVDYNQNITVLVFRGMQNNDAFDISVSEVRFLGNKVFVYADFREPNGLFGWFLRTGQAEQLIAYDIHEIITIDKRAFSGQRTIFYLVNNSNIVYEETIFIP